MKKNNKNRPIEKRPIAGLYAKSELKQHLFVWVLKPRHVTFWKDSADVRAIEMNLLSN